MGFYIPVTDRGDDESSFVITTSTHALTNTHHGMMPA